jgi:endonuclease/exonuclease/phosphatase family metal-dependent hydrolase
MKIASYNVENLFDRARAFNDDTPEARRAIQLEAELNTIFEKPTYIAANKKKILALLEEAGLLRSDDSKYMILRKLRGEFLLRPKANNKPVEVKASGRGDWVGWVELKMAHVNEISVFNTGRVLRDVDADIIAVIEAENRVALKQFSDYVLQRVDGLPYPHVMLIDGNDERGIDVGIMTKADYSIGLMRSHIHDQDTDGNFIFSRDCPEYCVTTPAGEQVWILPNHFKSKFGGNNSASQHKRKMQATRTAEIYQQLINEGHKNIIVLGDLNDTPESEVLQPLLAETDLRDVSEHPSFDTGEFAGKGTFGLGNDNNKIDYLLLSPSLFERVVACGLFRKGAWPGSNPKRWEVYEELEKPVHAGSDHHLIWCEID